MLRAGLPPPPVMCHMSRVICQIPRVTCHVSQFFSFSDQVVKLVVGGSLSTGPTPSRYYSIPSVPCYLNTALCVEQTWLGWVC